jgi:DNA-binding response OmpR family regulator
MYVLLVEDEALIREMLAEDLADAGLDVAEAPSAEVALVVAAAAGQTGKPPCVLVTDVNLGGGMDGLALAREVRRRWPEVGVVYVTGRPSKLDGHALGARERFLPKPFGPSRLTAAVHQLMGRSRRRGGADKGAPPSA